MPNFIAREVEHLKSDVHSKLKEQVAGFMVKDGIYDQLLLKRVAQRVDRIDWCWQAVLLLMVKAAHACFVVHYQSPILGPDPYPV